MTFPPCIARVRPGPPCSHTWAYRGMLRYQKIPWFLPAGAPGVMVPFSPPVYQKRHSWRKNWRSYSQFFRMEAGVRLIRLQLKYHSGYGYKASRPRGWGWETCIGKAICPNRCIRYPGARDLPEIQAGYGFGGGFGAGQQPLLLLRVSILFLEYPF